MAQTQQALELLLEVSRLLSSKLDLPELLQSVLILAAKVVDAETASLLLLDAKTNELYFDVALGLGENANKVRLKLGQGIAGSVAQTRAPAIINDAAADPRWSKSMDDASGFKTRSILAVPLHIKGQLIGVVEAINKKEGGFTDDDLRTFESFASQAAVAIDNARLFSSLKEERFKLRTVFMEMSDGAILAGPDGYILLANEAARKLLGIEDAPSAMLDDALRGLVMQPPIAEIAKTSGTVAFTATREQPKKLVLAGHVTRIELGFLILFRDDTEAALKERLKRTFLSLISHKLKTPLASVTGYADILLSEFKARPPQSPVLMKAAESVSAQGAKLADLVDKLLRYTTLDNPDATIELKPCGLDSIVDDTLRGMKDWLGTRDARVDKQPGNPIFVIGDQRQLSEVVKNLVENAVKFDEKPQPRVQVRVEQAASEAVLTVSDAGPGIPPEEHDKVFTRFHQIETYFTGQVDGWGLGLAYVKKVVEGHGGRVELRSKLGQGTTVIVRLPAKR
jgi:two-component system, NtrC family, sensor histidine kinase KinB